MFWDDKVSTHIESVSLVSLNKFRSSFPDKNKDENQVRPEYVIKYKVLFLF